MPFDPSRQMRRTVLLLGAAVLAGCSSTPPYQRPAVDVPPSFKEATLFEAAASQATVPDAWWQLFNDATLNALQVQLLVGNENLKGAVAQYRAAQAALAASRASLFPTLGVAAAGSRASSPATFGPDSSASVSASAAWEADLWGRLSSQVDSAQARLEASQADLAGVRLSLQATLAQIYFSLRAADAQADLLESTVQVYTRSLDVTQNRYRVGVVAASDVALAQTQLKSAQAQLVDVRIGRSQLEHAIAVLLGKQPSQFGVEARAQLPVAPAVPLQVPAQLLERRPDIATADPR